MDPLALLRMAYEGTFPTGEELAEMGASVDDVGVVLDLMRLDLEVEASRVTSKARALAEAVEAFLDRRW